MGSVFRTRHGAPLKPDVWHKERLKRLAKSLGLTVRRFGLHTLRHPYCTMLLDAGVVDLKYVSTQLGHSTIGITADIYTHALRKRSEAAMTALSELVKPNAGANGAPATTPYQPVHPGGADGHNPLPVRARTGHKHLPVATPYNGQT
jgi:Phage integrase family